MKAETPPGLTAAWALRNYEQLRAGGAADCLKSLRQAAIEQLAAGLPSTAVEDWKYTDLSAVAQGPFLTAPAREEQEAASAPIPWEWIRNQSPVVVCDGQPARIPDKARELGIVIESLCEISQSDKLRGAQAQPGDLAQISSAVVALNTAFAVQGLVVRVPAGKRVERPLVIVNYTSSGSEGVALHPRLFVRAEKGSAIRIVEVFFGQEGVRNLVNPVCELSAGESSEVRYTRVIRDSSAAYHLGAVSARIEAAASVDTTICSFGAQLVRNEISHVYAGERARSGMFGLSVGAEKQHIDNTTLLDHAHAHCESLELFKGIYGDESAGVFSGTIVVREDAQKTNAIQSNRSILLSDKARVETRPQLKIWADDVRCTHGATVGQLDQDALYYIRSRGVGMRDAQAMLVRAFASEVLTSVAEAAEREWLEALLAEQLDRL